MKARLLPSRSKGFTLIEVLVVIAIIALLAGVSYSIYSHATETAARTRCTDNLRRISDWGKEFAGQNGGKLPSSGMKDSLLTAQGVPELVGRPGPHRERRTARPDRPERQGAEHASGHLPLQE